MTDCEEKLQRTISQLLKRAEACDQKRTNTPQVEANVGTHIRLRAKSSAYRHAAEIIDREFQYE